MVCVCTFTGENSAVSSSRVLPCVMPGEGGTSWAHISLCLHEAPTCVSGCVLQEHYFAMPEPGRMAARINWRINKPDGDFIERSVLQVGRHARSIAGGAVLGTRVLQESKHVQQQYECYRRASMFSSNKNATDKPACSGLSWEVGRWGGCSWAWGHR